MSVLAVTVSGKTIKNEATYNSAAPMRCGMAPVIDVRTSPGAPHPRGQLGVQR